MRVSTSATKLPPAPAELSLPTSSWSNSATTQVASGCDVVQLDEQGALDLQHRRMPLYLVVDPSDDLRVMMEEIFGPITVATPFDTEEEALAMANDTKYGLNAMVFTENLSRAHRMAARLKAGTVWINCFFIRDLRAPFGGVGDSGVGREGGNFSREFFTEPKAVVMQITQ